MHFIEYTHISLDKCKEKAQKTCSKNFHSPLILQMQGPPSLYHHNCSMALTHDTRHNKLNNLGKCDFWRIKPQSVFRRLHDYLKEKKSTFSFIFFPSLRLSLQDHYGWKKIKTIDFSIWGMCLSHTKLTPRVLANYARHNGMHFCHFLAHDFTHYWR